MTIEEIKYFQNLNLTVNETKSLIQRKAINITLRDFEGRGVIEAYTGFGKGKIGRDSIERIKTKFPDAKIIILVPSLHLKTSWEEDTKQYTDVDVFVLNTYTISMGGIVNNCDLLLIDEVHHVLGEDSKFFSTALSKTNAKYKIGLSAKLSESQVRVLEENGLKISYQIELIDGIKLNLIPRFKIFNIGIDFTDSEKSDYWNWEKIMIDITNKWQPVKSVSGINLHDVAMWYATKKEKYETWSTPICKLAGVEDKNKQFNIPRVDFINVLADFLDITYNELSQILYFHNKCITEREKIIKNSINKLVVAKEFIETNVKKSIIFAPNEINISNKILAFSKYSETVAYNSSISKGKKQKILDTFKKDGFRNLLTIKALDEGFDLANIEVGLIMQIVGQSGNNIQRLGRILRYDENNPEKLASLIYIYMNSFEIENNETGEIIEVVPADQKRLKYAQKDLLNIYYVKNLKEYESLCDA